MSFNPATPDACPPVSREAFNLHRLRQSQRAQLLNRILVELAPAAGETTGLLSLPLRRAPDIAAACQAALGPIHAALLVPLRAVLGYIGAWEWRKTGVPAPGLADRIHVHYGVFSPNRGEYLDLVATAPLPSTELAFDVGTGSGVLACILAARGVARIIGTDQDDRALACAGENIQRLGFGQSIKLEKTDLFPDGRSPLIVCNPPWLPARPTTAIEHALYDPDSRMLLGFLRGLSDHLEENGEGWLIMSDFAELLGLRTRHFLPDAIAQSGLQVKDKQDTRPRHPKAYDKSDPLYPARRAETTSLWRLIAR